MITRSEGELATMVFTCPACQAGQMHNCEGGSLHDPHASRVELLRALRHHFNAHLCEQLAEAGQLPPPRPKRPVEHTSYATPTTIRRAAEDASEQSWLNWIASHWRRG